MLSDGWADWWTGIPSSWVPVGPGLWSTLCPSQPAGWGLQLQWGAGWRVFEEQSQAGSWSLTCPCSRNLQDWRGRFTWTSLCWTFRLGSEETGSGLGDERLDWLRSIMWDGWNVCMLDLEASCGSHRLFSFSRQWDAAWSKRLAGNKPVTWWRRCRTDGEEDMLDRNSQLLLPRPRWGHGRR